MAAKLSHTDKSGKATMVDVSVKPDQERTAEATGHITLAKATIVLIRENRLKKGDVLTVAEIAGIMGGKKTSELIPLCHPLSITKMEVRASLDKTGVRVNSLAGLYANVDPRVEVGGNATITNGQLVMTRGSITCPTTGYRISVKARTKIAFTRAGITTLPKNGANNMRPESRTPIVSSLVMIVNRGISII